MKAGFAMGVKWCCDRSGKRGRGFTPLMKGYTCADVCRICRQKRLSGWCVWRGGLELLFFNFVSKRQNRKFESGSPRKSGCFRTFVVEPNNLTRISEDLQLRKLFNVCRSGNQIQK